jgi:hypothetical protein
VSLAKSVGGAALAVVGAAAGLAAVVYFIGATTLWLALRSTDYSPDAAIEHQSRSQIIAVGLRGILVVLGIALILALVPITREILRRRALEKSTGVVSATTPPLWLRVVAAVFVLAFLGLASAVGWRWLTLAIVASVFLLLLVLPFRSWHAAAILLAAVLAALSWQYGGPVNVRAAVVYPRSAHPIEGISLMEKACTRDDGAIRVGRFTKFQGDVVWVADRNPCGLKPAMERWAIMDHFREVCPVPYFGESGDFVYLGAITDVREIARRECRWSAGPIVELRRDQVLLSFLRGEVFLEPGSHTPLRSTWETLELIAESVD